MSDGRPAAGCVVCDTMPPGDLTELDLLMGDASRWPATVWGIFDPPKGPPNAGRLRFGAVNVALEWLAPRGYTFSREVLRRHYRYDVPVVAADPVDLLNRGLIQATAGRGPGSRLPEGEQIDPTAFLTYFDRGIKLGNRALEMMATRVEGMIQRQEDVPFSMLKALADMGAKLAVTQAQLKKAGVHLGGEEDVDEGFRAGSMPLPSKRIGQTRIRVVDGEARPIADKGPADRETFSERSRQEGGGGLPH